MNVKGNQRSTATKNKIKYVFLELMKEKKPGQISVSEICSRAQIHRTTFYVHYQDVNQLMEQLVAEMYDQIMAFFLEKDETGEKLRRDGFLRLFEMIREHRDFFQMYLETFGSLTLGYDFLPYPLQERADQLVSDMGWDSEEELRYHQTFFCEGLSAVIRRWISRGCLEEPEQMVAIIGREYAPVKNQLIKRQMEER
ncbi:MAG: TetR family transcriptional regulator C-terminal domain-containing protein [Acetatifactor sp.]|nr:TetR family transcriptional regulator C-terminal domain-containing protein [Acetatifactor sp.]